MKRLAPWRSLCLLAILGCGNDSTGPAGSFSVAITAQLTTPGRTVGVNTYACDYTFTVTTSGGSSNSIAGWTNGEIDFRLNASGATTQLALSGSDLQDWFGVDKFGSGAKRTANRQLSWSGPFTASVLFRIVKVSDDLVPVSETIAVPITCS